MRSLSDATSKAAIEYAHPQTITKDHVNADDFGMSTETNRAIVEAFQNSVISSTTLMTDMPGLEEACELAHGHRLLGKIGLHLNLTSEYPLSTPIRQCPRFCNNVGMFRARHTRFLMSKEERLAVETEIATPDQGSPGSWAVSDALRLTSSCPHGVGHRRGCYHYRAPLWDTGYPTITLLWASDRSCPQMLQICMEDRLRMYGLAKT